MEKTSTKSSRAGKQIVFWRAIFKSKTDIWVSTWDTNKDRLSREAAIDDVDIVKWEKKVVTI